MKNSLRLEEIKSFRNYNRGVYKFHLKQTHSILEWERDKIYFNTFPKHLLTIIICK